eukprot:6214688-Pleurochrysis_carterae.AAC.5
MPSLEGDAPPPSACIVSSSFNLSTSDRNLAMCASYRRRCCCNVSDKLAGFTVALRVTLFARSAKRTVARDSSTALGDGLSVAMRSVRALPHRLGCSMRVSVESRNGTCARSRDASAEMQFARAESETRGRGPSLSRAALRTSQINKRETRAERVATNFVVTLVITVATVATVAVTAIRLARVHTFHIVSLLARHLR